MKRLVLILVLFAGSLLAAGRVTHTIPEWLTLAQQGDPVAVNTVLDAYFKHEIADSSYPDLLKLFLTFAEKGDLNYQNFVGQIYTLGKGMPVNETEAAKWFLRAAEQGDAFAQQQVGFYQVMPMKEEIKELILHYQA